MYVSSCNARRAGLAALFLFLIPSLTLPIASDPAQAQVFGMMHGPQALPQNVAAVSGGAFFDDNQWGFLGQGRYGFGNGWDAGAQVGAGFYDDSPTSDGPTTLLIEADGRKQVRWAAEDHPVDATLGFGFGVELADEFTRVLALPQAQAGHRITYDDAGRAVTPYGGLGLMIERLDVSGTSDTDFGLEARIGGLWEPSPGLGVNLEFGFGSQNKMLAGVRMPF